MKFGLTLILLLPICVENVFGQSLEFYVSVDGDDSWDGTAEANIDGSGITHK